MNGPTPMSIWAPRIPAYYLKKKDRERDMELGGDLGYASVRRGQI